MRLPLPPVGTVGRVVERGNPEGARKPLRLVGGAVGVGLGAGSGASSAGADGEPPEPSTQATPSAGAAPESRVSERANDGTAALKAVAPPSPIVALPPDAGVRVTPSAAVPMELDTLSIPEPEAPPVSVRRPILASEALMEDLAPVEPARHAARIWLAAVGAGSLLVGTLPAIGSLPGGERAASPFWFTGMTALVAALVPVSYHRRAVAMLVLGFLSSVVALQGVAGALMTADGGSAWAGARLAAAIALPAALLFRARYRAFKGARFVLGAAFAVSLPFIVHAVLSVFAAPTIATVGAVAVILMVAGNLSGFMGAETTGAGAALGPATVGVLTADLALRGLVLTSGSLRLSLGVATDAIAFGGASGLAALGAFQLLASRYAKDARRIDLHPTPIPAAEEATRSDWSTRA